MNDLNTRPRIGLQHSPRLAICLSLGLAVAVVVGCVERTVTIKSEPDGALVYLNDQEIGRAPVKVNFTWYGDYDIILRKKGYETLKTNRRIEAPWYQWPGIDFVAECMIPTTIHDDHDLGTFQLAKAKQPTKAELIRNAEEMRTMAVGGDADFEPPAVADAVE